jgi:hypothetical protein
MTNSNPEWAADSWSWPQNAEALTVTELAVTELAAGDLVDLQGDPYADPGHGDSDHMCEYEHGLLEVGNYDEEAGEWGDEPGTYEVFVQGPPYGYYFPAAHRLNRVVQRSISVELATIILADGALDRDGIPAREEAEKEIRAGLARKGEEHFWVRHEQCADADWRKYLAWACRVIETHWPTCTFEKRELEPRDRFDVDTRD